MKVTCRERVDGIRNKIARLQPVAKLNSCVSIHQFLGCRAAEPKPDPHRLIGTDLPFHVQRFTFQILLDLIK